MVPRVTRVTRAISLAAIVVAVVLGVLWIGQQDQPARPVEPTPSAVEVLSDFTLPDLEDQPRSITEWSGRSLVINFWATWCPPCRREMPLLQSLQDEHADGSLQVVGVALDNLADVKRFIAESNITYPILYGEHDASTIAESFGNAYVGLPFSVFVAPRGEILALWTGELFEDDLSRLVAELDAISNGQRSVVEARARLAME